MEKKEECCGQKHCDDLWENGMWECKWYSFGAPLGLALGFGIVLNSIGLFIYLLHLAGLIG